MTTATPRRPPRQGAPPRSVTVPPRVQPAGPGRSVRRSVFAASLITLFALVPLLAVYGLNRALESDGGTTVASSSVTDPAAPGYEALVTPTAALLVVQVAPDATLAGVTLLASGDAGGGGVLLVPPRLVVNPTGTAPTTLSDVFATGGADGVVAAVRRSFRIGIASVVSLDDARWAALVQGVGVISLDNTDDLEGTAADGVTAVAFSAGPLELEPEGVGPYLRLGVEGEDLQAGLYRKQLFWQAWMAAMAAQPGSGDALPGEANAGIGLMLRKLAGPAIDVRTVPGAVEASATTAGAEDFVADEAELARTLADIVPFPAEGVPGDRIRIRLLNGSGDQGAALGTAATLVPAGGEITFFGNADRFDYARTVVRYHDPAHEADAVALAAVLGTDQVVLEVKEQEPVDVTIVMGQDLTGTGTGG